MSKKYKIIENSNLSMDIVLISDIHIRKKDMPPVSFWNGQILFVLEAVYINESFSNHPIIINELICIKSTLQLAIDYITGDAHMEGWEDDIHRGFKFACYMVSLEFINNEDGPHDTYCFNSKGERVMNIKDPRPYRKDSYPD